MTDWTPESEDRNDDQTKVEQIVVDTFKHLQRTPTEEDPDPARWGDVWGRMNKALMSLVVNVVEVPAATLKAVKSWVKGIGRLPGSLADRLEPSRQKADAIEGKAQVRVEQTIKGQLPGKTVDEVREEIEAKLLELRARGLNAEVREINGSFIVVVTRPELLDQGIEAGRQALELKTPDEAVLREAVERLREERSTYGEALLLYMFQRLSYAQIADSLEIPLGTVKSRVHAGIEWLNAYLTERGFAPVNLPAE